MSQNRRRNLGALTAIAFGVSILLTLRPFHWPEAFISIGGAILFSYLAFIADRGDK